MPVDDIEFGLSGPVNFCAAVKAAPKASSVVHFAAAVHTSPDVEILNAIRPAMATIPGAMLLCASNPHGKFGALWKAFERHYGKEDSSTLIWRAPTRTMHPAIPQAFIDDAISEDPEKARAEYLAEFRSDVSRFIDRDIVDALVRPGVHEEPPNKKESYVAFVDPSGGAADSFVIAVAYRKEIDNVSGEGVAVLACLREFTAPFSPDSVVAEIAGVLRLYEVDIVIGDRYAGEWPPDRFAVHGISPSYS